MTSADTFKVSRNWAKEKPTRSEYFLALDILISESNQLTLPLVSFDDRPFLVVVAKESV